MPTMPPECVDAVAGVQAQWLQPGERLAIFDLDNTLLTGDSDTLWCDYLLQRGELPASFAETNRLLEQQYRVGQATAAAFSAFFASTLAGRSPQQWQAVRAAFMAEVIRPRIPEAARVLVAQHQAQGHVLVLSSATNRFLCELTAADLGFAHLIATELEQAPDGRFSGATQGTLNMREGKLQRLHEWLALHGVPDSDDALAQAWFYSDSINDLPLLSAVGSPVVVDPDTQLLLQAQRRGWPVLRLPRPPFQENLA